ncbi:MAG: branched-chain amino acid transaminase [Candidatus Altiarchaeales archaeon]|nr:branched-chain amino acid transaminase [Candidatus Altiarchaeales archaeon]
MPFTESEKIWFNGEFVDWGKAQTHVLTHALHYGSGVFEGIRCYETKNGSAVFRNTDHVRRLFDSAKIYFMDVPYTEDEFRAAIKDTVKINELNSCYIRPIIYRGYGEMGLNPLDAVVDCAIAAWPWGTYLGEEGLKNGITTIISGYERINSNIMPCQAKACGQYINSILAKVEALKAGVDEAILLDSRGKISEGPGENLFLVKDGRLITPPFSASILPGITRASVIEVAQDLGFEVSEQDIDRGHLYTADELFFTGTAAEVTPIREVDGREIGKPGPTTKKIQNKFFEIVKGEEKKYGHWLDYI